MIGSFDHLHICVACKEAGAKSWVVHPGTKGGLSFVRSPSVPEEEGRAHGGFMDITRTTLEHGRWLTIFELVGRGVFDDKGGGAQFLMEDRKGIWIPLVERNPSKHRLSALGSSTEICSRMQQGRPSHENDGRRPRRTSRVQAQGC